MCTAVKQGEHLPCRQRDCDSDSDDESFDEQATAHSVGGSVPVQQGLPEVNLVPASYAGVDSCADIRAGARARNIECKFRA